MPTYEYRCANGHAFEQFQKMSDPAVEVCPECGAAAERLMSAGAGLVFKGSGFYITDYRGDAYKKAAESDKAGTAGSAGAAAPAPAPAASEGGKAEKPATPTSTSSSTSTSSESSSKPATGGSSSSGGKSGGKSGDA
jgi:putative FmdB family regulatory protein